MAGARTPAIRALIQEKVDHRVYADTHDPRSGSYGAEAVNALAERLGLAPDQIFKTLVIELSTGGLALVILPVTRALSVKAAASALGAPKARMAAKATAERNTGYVVGGISPPGQKRALPTVLDQSTPHWDHILCSAGRRGLEIGLAPADLVRLTKAVLAAVAAV